MTHDVRGVTGIRTKEYFLKMKVKNLIHVIGE